jgi:hypothetical protein
LQSHTERTSTFSIHKIHNFILITAYNKNPWKRRDQHVVFQVDLPRQPRVTIRSEVTLLKLQLFVSLQRLPDLYALRQSAWHSLLLCDCINIDILLDSYVQNETRAISMTNSDYSKFSTVDRASIVTISSGFKIISRQLRMYCDLRKRYHAFYITCLRTTTNDDARHP